MDFLWISYGFLMDFLWISISYREIPSKEEFLIERFRQKINFKDSKAGWRDSFLARLSDNLADI
jgi:hypothetical protein